MSAMVVECWQAWSPGLPDRTAWRRWFAGGARAEGPAKPALKQVPAMIRRRCGQNARMVLASALNLLEETGVDPTACHLVFGSANGENHALKALLEDLCRNEPLSPTAFTNSLHHVPTGYFSIVSKHKGVSRTISAFEDTFACAWLDMVGLLGRLPELPLLLMCSDEIPPEPFDRMLAVPEFDYAVCMLVRPARTGESGVVCRPAAEGAQLSQRSHQALLFDFLKWYDGEGSEFTAATSFGAITWRKL